MDILMSVHKKYLSEIFAGNKPFEFRNVLPKNLSKGDTIYFYETSKNGGCKKIVGEAKIKDFHFLLNSEGEYPLLGAYNFIDFWCENFLHNSVYAEQFRLCKKYNLTNYKYGSQIDFALSYFCMKYIMQDEWPPIEITMLPNVIKERKMANDLLKECDRWLRKIGFYNEYDESYWKYAIEINNIKKYDFPISLAAFTDNRGNIIKGPPQSWMYCNKKI